MLMVLFTCSAHVQIRALSSSLLRARFLTGKVCFSSSFATRSTYQIHSCGGGLLDEENNTYRYIQSQNQTREIATPISTTRSFSTRARNRRQRRGGGDLGSQSTNESSVGEDRDSSHHQNQGGTNANAIHKPDVIMIWF